MKSIAIFGAGPALGLSTARRFGREGFAVDVVGRRPETVDSLVVSLRGDGIDVHGTVADLADGALATDALATITDRRGQLPNVVVYSPGDVSRLPVGVGELTSRTLAEWLPLNLTTPLDLIHELLPGFAERGSGTVVVAQGTAARVPSPALTSVGVAQSALLNYLLAVGAEFRAAGVRITSLQIGKLIERSAAAQLFATGHFDDVEPNSLPTVDPDHLADLIWQADRGTAVEELVA